MSKQKYDSSDTMRSEDDVEKHITEAVESCIENCKKEDVDVSIIADELEAQARKVRLKEMDESRYDVGQHLLAKAAGEFELVLRAYHRVFGEDEKEQDLSNLLHRLEAIMSEYRRMDEEISPIIADMDEEDD